jgi:hypothetical protein
METVTVESIPIVVGREEDGRWWADIESMPGGLKGVKPPLIAPAPSACAWV